MKNRRESGFSLIEVLVVLVLLGLTATMVASLIEPRTQRAKLIAFQAALESRFSEASIAARERGSATQLRFDAGRRRIEGDHIRPLPVPSDVTLNLVSAREIAALGEAAILFFPDGTNSGLDYQIILGELRARGALSWLGGRAAKSNP
jgi:general secretion pathway protein H